jgi:hypothetical protein
MANCPVCGDSVREHFGHSHGELFDCSTCGPFVIPGLLISMLRSHHAELMPYLSAHLRQFSTRQNPLLVSADTFLEWADAHARASIPQKRLLILEHVARKSSSRFGAARFGATVQFGQRDYPLFDCYDQNELVALVDSLEADKLLLRRAAGPLSYELTNSGWSAVAPVGGGVIGTAFVAMSWDPTLTAAYDEGIAPALQDCGIHPIHIGRKHHNNNVDNEMIAEIRRAQFMVADLTLQRAGVYFEAGFARGLGREVIWSCEEKDFHNIHFDTRQFSYTRWSNYQELHHGLRDRIRATGLAQKV